MLDENIIDSIKGAAWQLKKPEVKKEMVIKLADLIAKGLYPCVNKDELEANRRSLESTANSILRWPDRDNIRKHALMIAKRIDCNFNKSFYVLRSSLDKVKKGSTVTEEGYEEYTDYEARKQEEGIEAWNEKICAAVAKKLNRQLTPAEKTKLINAVEDGKWANYFDKSDNQAAIDRFAQMQDVIKEESFFNY